MHTTTSTVGNVTPKVCRFLGSISRTNHRACVTLAQRPAPCTKQIVTTAHIWPTCRSKSKVQIRAAKDDFQYLGLPVCRSVLAMQPTNGPPGLGKAIARRFESPRCKESRGLCTSCGTRNCSPWSVGIKHSIRRPALRSVSLFSFLLAFG